MLLQNHLLDSKAPYILRIAIEEKGIVEQGGTEVGLSRVKTGTGTGVWQSGMDMGGLHAQAPGLARGGLKGS